ncbi:PEP/pyruvate-binding domain-containing protein [Paenibacillus beijingensis]|uniref:PEP/pyruvate-binding domain-containing protein n=1 Tax=Paenibacillus beijingensis TaxID=1126833 RepID=UPI000695B61E|nr:PEP/pyruvate-binding domain-containing protein [Paenibacillus beijingensis]
MRSIIPLSEAAAEDALVIGGKAKTIALLLQSHFPVPGGFIIPSYAFAYGFTEELHQEIEEAYRKYIVPPAVVRSSCSIEDLGFASFAGQYETILNVTSVNMLESIKRCRQSDGQAHARSYLVEKVPACDRAPAMAILVQECIDAEVAGVIFSKNPVTGNEDEIIINSSFGLGETVVSGRVTPDYYILSKRSSAIVKKELGDKDCKLVLDPVGTRTRETTAEEKSSFSLRDEQLDELTNMAMAIEALLGYSVDLEFAYRQGKPYILQARPITS